MQENKWGGHVCFHGQVKPRCFETRLAELDEDGRLEYTLVHNAFKQLVRSLRISLFPGLVHTRLPAIDMFYALLFILEMWQETFFSEGLGGGTCSVLRGSYASYPNALAVQTLQVEGEMS